MNSIIRNCALVFPAPVHGQLVVQFHRMEVSAFPAVADIQVTLLEPARYYRGRSDRGLPDSGIGPSTDVKVQFSSSNAINRPQSGGNRNNYSSRLYTMPVTLDVTQFKTTRKADRSMYWWNTNDQQLNPYWSVENILNTDVRDRFIMNGSLKYQFLSWLDAEIKAGGDMYTTSLETKQYYGAPTEKNGKYSNGTIVSKRVQLQHPDHCQKR